MNYRFLCCRHRQWLVEKPTRAAPTWTCAMNTANSLVARGECFQALPHVGSAFETAQLMVTDAQLCDGRWLQRRSAASQLLRMVLEKTGCPGQGGSVAAAATVTIH